MKVETIADVVHWAHDHHAALSASLEASVGEAEDERARLLLSYLADHERKLTELLDVMESDGDRKALHTWCYDFLDSYALERESEDDSPPWSELSTTDITLRIVKDHNNLLELYRHLHTLVDTDSARALVGELIALEEHEAMRVAHGANRLNDI